MSFLTNLFSSSNESVVKKLGKNVEQINALEKKFEGKSQDQLKELTTKWKADLALLDLEQQKKYLDEILPQAFAAVREAAKRTIGQRHYDVQLIGGMVLHQGSIAEMRTGEGKTLVATLPLYLNALTSRGAHLVTVNDYLARWQASWMGQIYHYLGLSVASIQHEQSFLYDPGYAPEEEEIKRIESEVQGLVLDVKHMRPIPRRQAYASDITYGTNNEYGFDYLRDNMVWEKNQMAQRDLHFAIVDEVDSILIDEARTPLIISAPDTDSTDLYFEFAKFVAHLTPEDYILDEKHKQIAYSDKGNEKLEKKYGQQIYSDPKLRHQADAALRAKILFKKDTHYVVRDNEVVIVDEFTGRMMYGRRYSEGLHQAIEAKEGVKVQQESKTLATITFQNYFRLYYKLAGMTGTAETEAEEFHKIYSLEVVQIPTNRPMVRKDLPDQIFKNVTGKLTAFTRAVREMNATGRPILIGTISIEKNEMLSQLLTQAGVPHEILNAKNNEREAHIIAQAGRLGAVTLATNIAGRGVDILLGGNPVDSAEQAKVKELGGLAVMGTERHESRRIDNQLRGRSGRQGDPGSSQFFLSLEDDLMRLFGGERVQKMMETLGIADDEAIQAGMISKSIESAQRKIEGLNFDMRKHVLEYDDVMNKQRTVIYGKRKQLLDRSESLTDEILEMIEKEITTIVNFGFEQDEIKYDQIFQEIAAMLPLQPSEKVESGDQIALINHYTEIASREYKNKQQKLGEMMNQMEKFVYLRSIDTLWQEHLDTMEHLRDSVRLRGYGQRDPLNEFKNEGFQLFQSLLEEINRQVATTIFKADMVQNPTPLISNQEIVNGEIGRNDPCPCGSGKKWKRCGLLQTEEHKKLMSIK